MPAELWRASTRARDGFFRLPEARRVRRQGASQRPTGRALRRGKTRRAYRARPEPSRRGVGVDARNVAKPGLAAARLSGAARRLARSTAESSTVRWSLGFPVVLKAQSKAFAP